MCTWTEVVHIYDDKISYFTKGYEFESELISATDVQTLLLRCHSPAR